jgi:hypothetical protein
VRFGHDRSPTTSVVPPDPSLEPGSTLELDTVLTDETPLGSIDRVVELRSPQLSAPERITYRIITRRDPLIIVFAIGIGLLLGLIARRLPAWVSKRSVLSRQRQEVQAAIAGLLARYPNAPNRELLVDQKDRLGGLDSLRPLRELSKRLDHAVEVANGWIEDLESALEPLRTELATLEPPLLVDWQLPEEPAGVLAEAKQLRDEARRALEAGDVERARSLIENLKETLGEFGPETNQPAQIARLRIAGDMEALAAALEGVAAPSRLSYVRNLARQLAALCRQPDHAGAGVADRLRALHQIQWATENLTEELRVAVEEIAAGKVAVADDRRVEMDRRLADAREILASPTVDSRLVGLAVAIQNVVGLLDVGHGAADQKAAEMPAPVAPSPKLLAAAAFAPLSDRLAGASGVAFWSVFGVLTGVLRYLVLSVLLVLTSYKWFADDWYGTLGQISTVIVWAFGVDVSVELVMQVARKGPVAETTPRTPPPPSAEVAWVTPVPDPGQPIVQPTAPTPPGPVPAPVAVVDRSSGVDVIPKAK